MPTIEITNDDKDPKTPGIPKMHKSNDLVLPIPQNAVRINRGNSPANTSRGASPRNRARSPAPASPRNSKRVASPRGRKK